jgi:hypothetical protein
LTVSAPNGSVLSVSDQHLLSRRDILLILLASRSWCHRIQVQAEISWSSTNPSSRPRLVSFVVLSLPATSSAHLLLCSSASSSSSSSFCSIPWPVQSSRLPHSLPRSASPLLCLVLSPCPAGEKYSTRRPPRPTHSPRLIDRSIE